MIDWITAIVKFQHGKSIGGNITTQEDWNGNLKWRTQGLRALKGSFEDQVSIQSRHIDGHCSHLKIHGNVAKFFQGHNVFGTDDVKGLLSEFLLAVPNHVDIEPQESPIAHVLDAKITRLDLTYNFRLENREQVEMWISSTEQSATIRHGGRGQFTSGTLYFNKKSRRWALKFYSKGKELESNKHKHRAANQQLRDHADGLLRGELVFRSMELKKQGLDTVRAIDELDIGGLAEFYEKYLHKLEIGHSKMKLIDIQAELNGNEKSTYQLWLEGHDVRQFISKATFYRHKKHIYEVTGNNIAAQRTDVKPIVNIPTIEFIQAKFEPVPEWANGTHFYFEPRAGLKAVA